MKPILLGLALAIAVSGPLSACSSKRNVRTETTQSSGIDPDVRTQYRHEEIETEENSDSSDCSGVLSCGVDVIGEIIAFPFRAVGALARAIF